MTKITFLLMHSPSVALQYESFDENMLQN